MMAMNDDRDEERSVSVKTVMLSALLALVLVAASGIVGGAGFALLDGGGKGPLAIIIVILIVGLGAGAIALWGLLRLKPWTRPREPMGPRTRTANNMMLLSAALGGFLGVVMSITTVSSNDPFALFSNGPMSKAVVIPALAVWLLIVPIISVQWHRSVDEHEAEAYKFGGLAALYLYAFATPAWWLAARGGLMPPPDAMLIFLGVMVVWCVGWFWRRYR